MLGGCAASGKRDPAYYHIEQGNLPPVDVRLNIPGLGPCTDNPDRTLRLNTSQPINVLTHGCFGSSGEFRGLAQVLAFQGQQTACFTYDDRDALDKSATALRNAVNRLAEQTRTPQIVVIGHSQGALIARRSLTDLPVVAPSRQPDLRLVTISGPFNGIASAETCGRKWLSWASIGLLPVSCYIVTGAKWMDITYSSDFIREPGTLIPEVASYLKIDTDERGTCRREQDGRCLESDDIFSLAEQHNPKVENDPRARRIEVGAGHVEIVGDKRIAPRKLITVLQQQGVLRPTASGRAAEFNQMLARVYRDDSLLQNAELP
ncbi:MAG: alpha/beta hydrolase [Gammaproteobacteria bacterium]|nr:alpha/beta hydrolase [Gammaproteobacteria bacterium]MBU1481629.1 alpha/beta hydrolase [Gammaproteobacteria bacterium]